MAITDRLPSRLRRRAGGLVLPIVLLAGVFTATLGAGYSATQTNLGDAIGHLFRGNSITVINSESRTVEAEVPTTATGTQDAEVTALPGGNIGTTNHDTGEVQLRDAGTLQTKGSPIASAGTPLVLPAGNVTYVLDPKADTVRQLGENGQVVSEVKVPGATRTAVPDGGDGIWVLTDDGKVSHVVQGRADRTTDPRDRVTTLTTADGPIAITSSGKALDLSVDPPKPIHQGPVPGDQGVLPGSHKGSGRYVLLLSPAEGKLVAVDRNSETRREFKDLPKNRRLGQPVQLGHLVFIPDYGTPHKLYVRDIATGSPRPDITVPGLHDRFELKVQNGRVWADDQFDQQSVVIGADGGKEHVDKGPGEGVLTNTNDPNWSPGEPVKPEPPATPETTPPPTVPPTTPPTTTPPAPTQTPPPAPPTQTPPPTTGNKLIPPPVVGMLVDDGCRSIEARTLTCDRQPMPDPSPTPSDLNVITAQNPAKDTPVDSGSPVTVRFWRYIAMPAVSGQAASATCDRLVNEMRRLVTCRAVPGSGTGTPGTVDTQNPAAGAPVGVNTEIVLTYVPTPIPTVPDVRNMPVGNDPGNACAEVASKGYTCVPVADRIARADNVVLDQVPSPGTPQQGGPVEVHYSPHKAQKLVLLRSDPDSPDNPDVHIIRFEGQEPPGYARERELGWAYPPQGTPIPHGARQINGFMCSASKSACGGRSPNHYYTHDNNTNLASWRLTETAAWLLPSNGGQCAADQTPLARLGRFGGGGSRVYTVHPHGSATAPSGWDYAEPLGCVWNP
ncbi:hypothetical protein [Lentzea terrae]|uniref:hypothetical protein n=1 Tax=Lentzea terrae TaxID=2200761 RepID=UPI0013009442|nr:hypothetical protein [Lentzea terrae]